MTVPGEWAATETPRRKLDRESEFYRDFKMALAEVGIDADTFEPNAPPKQMFEDRKFARYVYRAYQIAMRHDECGRVIESWGEWCIRMRLPW
jgi:hypothetical protein